MPIGTNLLAKILDKNLPNVFVKLKKEWFIDYEKEIYDYIKNFFDRYKRLPSLETLEEEFEVGYNIKEPVQYYIDKFTNRTIDYIVSKYSGELEEAYNSSDNKDKLVSTLNKISEEINYAKTLLKIEVKTAKDLATEVLDSLINSRTHPTAIPTGWPTLNAATGGMHKGNIFLVLARVKMGKTLCLLHMANHSFNEGYKTLFISMEMTSKEIGLRLVGLRRHLNLNLLVRNPASTFVERILREEIEQLRDGFYFVEGQFKSRISDIVGLIETYHPDIVFIDGGYLIRPEKISHKSKWEIMSDIIVDLKTVAMTMDIPVVVSFQFNRQVKRGTKELKEKAFEHIQLSDAISQVATTGISILENEDIPNTRKIEIIGGRHGEQGSFIINWDWERSDFSEYNL